MHMYVTHTQDTLFHRKTPSTDGSPIVPKISGKPEEEAADTLPPTVKRSYIPALQVIQNDSITHKNLIIPSPYRHC